MPRWHVPHDYPRPSRRSRDFRLSHCEMARARSTRGGGRLVTVTASKPLMSSSRRVEPHRKDPPLRELLAGTRASTGGTLLEMSEQRPVLLVFLRHFG